MYSIPVLAKPTEEVVSSISWRTRKISKVACPYILMDSLSLGCLVPGSTYNQNTNKAIEQPPIDALNEVMGEELLNMDTVGRKLHSCALGCGV